MPAVPRARTLVSQVGFQHGMGAVAPRHHQLVRLFGSHTLFGTASEDSDDRRAHNLGVLDPLFQIVDLLLPLRTRTRR